MSAVDPDSFDTPPTQPPFSSRRSALLGALDRLNPKLSTMYLGALQVLVDKSNPDRLPQSAQSLRELMEKLPIYLNVPTTAHPGELGQKVAVLQSSFAALCRTRGPTPADWSGDIDQGMRDFMIGMAGFFEWRRQQPDRREEARGTIAKLEVSGRQLPSKLIELHVDEWHECRKYFANVAHHRGNVIEREFESNLEIVERFLMDQFTPQTFEDYDEIDKIVREDRNA